MPYRIDAGLKEYIEAGVATIVGTGNSAGRPHVTFGWAPRVKDETTIEVFIDAERADKTLANLQENPRIAVTFADPVSYRSVQLKGKFEEKSDVTDADKDYVRERREGFAVTTALVGDPPETIRNLWMEETIKLSLRVENAFDQTPGPNAGKPL